MLKMPVKLLKNNWINSMDLVGMLLLANTFLMILPNNKRAFYLCFIMGFWLVWFIRHEGGEKYLEQIKIN